MPPALQIGTRYSTLVSKKEQGQSRHFEVQVHLREKNQKSGKEIPKLSAAESLEQGFFVEAQALCSDIYHI